MSFLQCVYCKTAVRRLLHSVCGDDDDDDDDDDCDDDNDDDDGDCDGKELINKVKDKTFHRVGGTLSLFKSTLTFLHKSYCY